MSGSLRSERPKLSASMKDICDSCRMIILYQLVDLILKIAPRNNRGNAWVMAIYAVSKQEMREEGVEL